MPHSVDPLVGHEDDEEEKEESEIMAEGSVEFDAPIRDEMTIALSLS